MVEFFLPCVSDSLRFFFCFPSFFATGFHFFLPYLGSPGLSSGTPVCSHMERLCHWLHFPGIAGTRSAGKSIFFHLILGIVLTCFFERPALQIPVNRTGYTAYTPAALELLHRAGRMGIFPTFLEICAGSSTGWEPSTRVSCVTAVNPRH